MKSDAKILFLGREPPELTQTPTMHYDVEPIPNLPPGVTADQIVFVCDYNEPEPDLEGIFFDVTFLIGNEAVFPVKDLQKDDFPAVLKETDFGSFQDDNHEPNLGYGNNVSYFSPYWLRMALLLITTVTKTWP